MSKKKGKEKKDPSDSQNSNPIDALSKEEDLKLSQSIAGSLSKSSNNPSISIQQNIYSSVSNNELNKRVNDTTQSQLNTIPGTIASSDNPNQYTNNLLQSSEKSPNSSNNKTSIKSSNNDLDQLNEQSSSEMEIEEESQTDAEINQLLLSIVSGFSEYFYNVANEIFGRYPKKIAFDSIRSDRKIGTTGIQLVTVNFSCELGHVRAGLAVKIHNNAAEVLPIVENINFLVQCLEPYRFLGVSTPKIVFQKGQILVLEGISGESFRHSPVPITEKFRLAGKCLAALCGSQSHKVNSNRYRSLEKQVLEALPIDENLKKTIGEKLSHFPLEKLSQECGAISFGDFHSGNLLYEINLYKSPILVAHLIDPEFLQKDSDIDRFEDIANFFVNLAIKEFELKNNLFQITREIRSFLAGYNEVLAYALLSIETFYPEGSTFNYHLALGILLSILNLLNIGMAPAYIDSQVKLRVKLVNLLLDSPPILNNSTELASTF